MENLEKDGFIKPKKYAEGAKPEANAFSL